MSHLRPRRPALSRARAHQSIVPTSRHRLGVALAILAFASIGFDGRVAASPQPRMVAATSQPLDGGTQPLQPSTPVTPFVASSASASPSKPRARSSARPAVFAKPTDVPRPRVKVGGAVPPAPPNGTYVYAIARGGTDQGKSTVVIFRRATSSTIEVDESLSVGQFRAHVVGGYSYDSLVPNLLLATYQAPFPSSALLGRETRFRPHVGDFDQATVRYAFDSLQTAEATIDGVQGALEWPLAPAETRSPLTGMPTEATPAADATPETQFARTHEGSFALDGPVMSGWAMLPAWLRKSGAVALTPVGAAFPEYVKNVRVARIALPPRSKKTPRDVIAKRVGDFATIWFDPQSQIVYDLHLDSLNLDIRLLSYSKVTTTAPFEPVPTPAPTPEAEKTALSVSVDGGSLAGVVQYPSGAKRPVPAVVLIAPPVGDALPTRSFDGNESHAIFVSLANALLKRGYAVARYDARGVGASGGSYADLTWETSVSDAAAVIRDVEGIDGIDGSRVFAAGYGSGADLAFAVSGDSENNVVGVVALGPTLVSYREALHRQFVNAQTKPEERANAERAFEHELKRLGRVGGAPAPAPAPSGDADPSNGGTWYKSALGHDPAALASRSDLPAFVLHGASLDPARTSDDVRAFDDRLRANDSLATVVVASDLSAKFGGRYDADSPESSEAIFPYVFDASTAGAIADWMDGVHAGMHSTRGSGANATAAPRGYPTPPKPPPLPTGARSSNPQGVPVKRKPIDDVQPGQVGVPSTMQFPPLPPSASPSSSATPAPSPTRSPTASAPPTLSPPAPHAT